MKRCGLIPTFLVQALQLLDYRRSRPGSNRREPAWVDAKHMSVAWEDGVLDNVLQFAKVSKPVKQTERGLAGGPHLFASFLSDIGQSIIQQANEYCPLDHQAQAPESGNIEAIEQVLVESVQVLFVAASTLT